MPLPVYRLSADHARLRIDESTDPLLDYITAGASVSFMASVTRQRLNAFWHGVVDDVAAMPRILLVCDDNEGRLVGPVQLITALPDNQPHRGEVAKLLVKQAARRQGIARALKTRPYQSNPEDSLAQHIDELWPVLTHEPQDHIEYSSPLPLPQAYIVPGGRFSETYYWDSYFTMLSELEAVTRDEGKMLLVLDTATGSPAERFYHQTGWQRAGTIPDFALNPDGSRCSTTLFYRQFGANSSDYLQRRAFLFQPYWNWPGCDCQLC